ncbi:MAG TPA: nucleotidyltransferase family protein [Limnochordia bacterium]|nr:nucleotidyltransferase family protein [Limnochordia bacterium]
MDAIVLAGAPNDGRLERVAPDVGWEALIPLGGRPMISYVVDALTASRSVKRIIVVGPGAALRAVLPEAVEVAEAGEGMIDNILIGTRLIADGRRVLIVTSDVPLLTARAVDDFLQRCSGREADVYYPIVTKDENERYLPGVQRTYVRLKDGTFTGGNLVLLAPQVVEHGKQLIEQAIAMRKKPWQLSRMLGFRFIVKFFLHKLDLAEIEAQVGDVLGFSGAAIVSPFPEVGIDVDKPSDLEMVRALVEQANRRIGPG